MLISQHKIILLTALLFPWTLSAWDNLIEDKDPYAVSKSGYFEGEIDYGDNCKKDYPDVMKNLRIAIIEKGTLGRARQMSSSIDSKKWKVGERVPYQDYIIRFYHVREREIIKEYRVPAYHSPKKFDFAFNCETIMKQIYEARKQRNLRRKKKK